MPSKTVRHSVAVSIVMPSWLALGLVLNNIGIKTSSFLSSFFLKVGVMYLEFMYIVFTRMPGDTYRRRLRSLLLYLYCVFRALVNSLVC